MEESQFDFEQHNLTYISKIADSREGKIKVFHVKQNNQSYALKAIPKSYFDDKTKIQYIYNEKDALMDFDHPGIIKLIKTIKDKSYICLLLELAYGCTLHQILKVEKRINEDFVKFIGIQLAVILKYIHSKGYIYRDIKASNIIVSKEGRVKLVDMGLAKKINEGRTSSFCGTLHAVAPEVFECETQGYSYEVDYYSFGILLYELIVGEPPFGYETSTNIDQLKGLIIEGITKDKLQNIKHKELQVLIKGLLEKDKDKRIGSKKGFDEVIEHPFFYGYNIEEVESFFKGKRLDDTSFNEVQDKCEEYFELIYLSGLHPDPLQEDKGEDPFKQFF